MTDNRKLIICGIGVFAQENIEKLEQADVVITRGGMAQEWLAYYELVNTRLFMKNTDQPLEDWKKELFSEFPADATIAYLTTITPIITDQVAATLCQGMDPQNVEIGPGDDWTQGLFILQSPMPANPLVVLDSLALEERHHPPFSADNSLLIYALPDVASVLNVKNVLSKILLATHSLMALCNHGNGAIQWRKLQLDELSEVNEEIVLLFVPAASSDCSLESFQEVIAHLRAPEDGCPWDKKQTHESLRTYLLEETYEALEALDKKDNQSLKEELGDILLQILLHAQIASENQEFSMADVIRGINRKIIYRHPHVFKDWVVDGERDVVQNWESLKERERRENGDESKKGMLDGVPTSFPSLAQAQAIQDRAARVGFDWPEIAPVLAKVMEELDEVKTAENDQERAKELGDLLFAVVNLVRWYKVDAESALRQTNQKFRKRFAYIEEKARQAGKELNDMTLEEMDVYWEEAKPFDD